MRTRERAAWRKIGEDYPFFVSAFFSRESVAYHAAQRTIGDRYPFSTLLGKWFPVLVLLLALGGGAAWVWFYAAHEWFLVPAALVALLVVVPVLRRIGEFLGDRIW